MLPIALRQLMQFQATARTRMLIRRIATRRRWVVSTLAVLLGCLWLGQTLISLLLREPTTPEKLADWIPASMTAYAAWQILKAVTRPPIEPFEWTPTERELLLAGPVERRDLVHFRIVTIARAAILKALCFTLLMSPDLPIWFAGLAGMFMGLMLIDSIRMAWDIFIWSVTPSTFRRIRAAVLVIAATVAASGLISALSEPPAPGAHLFYSFMMRFVMAVVDLRHTWPGYVATLPFQFIGSIVLAADWNLMLMAKLLGCVIGLCSSAALLVRMDAWCTTKRATRERAEFPRLSRQQSVRESAANPTAQADDPKRVPYFIPPRWAGIGTLAWRQALGISHYPSGVFVAMVLPGMLSLIPLAMEGATKAAMIQVVGSLVFYSFLLMPAALRFDFRRDVDRFAVLKSLPIRPWILTMGQMTAPIVSCSLFQLVVLLVAMCIRPYPLLWLAVFMLFLIPINGVIFGLENVIFMTFPYRPNQEGVVVFIRSILTFTGKGLLFGLAVVATLCWILCVRWLTGHSQDSTAQSLAATWLFMGGLWFMTILAAGGMSLLTARLFEKFDPSQDLPAMS